MAAGAAVVASDAGGLPEVVIHDKTGTLSFAGDPRSLAWGILRVLNDPARAATMKKAARDRLTTDFAWEGIADQTVAVYHRVWREFLASYWTDETVWPVVPGAEERAAAKRLREKASSGSYVPRPMPTVSMPGTRLTSDDALAGREAGEDDEPGLG
jgi:hypothetical protein